MSCSIVSESKKKRRKCGDVEKNSETAAVRPTSEKKTGDEYKKTHYFILNRKESISDEATEKIIYGDMETLKNNLSCLGAGVPQTKKRASPPPPPPAVAAPERKSEVVEWVEYVAHIDMVKSFWEAISGSSLDAIMRAKLPEESLCADIDPRAYDFPVREAFFMEKSKKQKEIFLPISILDKFNLFENKGKKAKIEKKNQDANFIKDIDSAEKMISVTNNFLHRFNNRYDFSPIEIVPFFFEPNHQTIHIHSNYKNFSEMSVKQQKYFLDCYTRIIKKRKKKLSKITVSIIFYMSAEKDHLCISEQNGITWLDSAHGTPTI